MKKIFADGNKFLILLLTLFGILIFQNTKAAYLEDVPTRITQPDGRILECFITGDEFFRRLHDKEGYTIIKHPETRWYVYAVRS